MEKKWHLLLDIFFYFFLPIFIWEIGRGGISDYVTMILSSFPGIAYSFFRFLHTKSSLNFTRLILLLNILIGLIIDLCSGSALQLLWNDTFYSLSLCVLYLASCFFHKPLIFYFALDILALQGYDRKLTKEILLKKESQRVLRTISVMNGIREFIYTITVMKGLSKYGVEIYTFSIWLDQLLSFTMSVISVAGFFYINRFMNQIVSVKKNTLRKQSLKLPGKYYYYYFESSYFFLRKHFL